MSSSQPGQRVIKLDQLGLQDLLRLKEQLSQVNLNYLGPPSLPQQLQWTSGADSEVRVFKGDHR